MPEVSKWNVPESLTDSRSLRTNAEASATAGRKTSPGLVQNWPAPRVNDAYSAAAILSTRSRSAPGRMKTGFVLLISAKTGGLHQWMFDQSRANTVATVEQK